MRLLSSFLFRLHNIPLLVAAAGILVAGAGSAELARLGGGLNYLSSSANSTFLASPNPVPSCGSDAGKTMLSWNASGSEFEVRSGTETGVLIASSFGPGQQQVSGISSPTSYFLRKGGYEWRFQGGKWVRVFSWSTIAQIQVAVSSQGCASTGAVSPTNVALASNGGVATASSLYPDGRFTVQSINDGNRGTAWAKPEHPGWADATNNRFPDWAQVRFSGPKSIDRINLFTLQDNSRLGQPLTETEVFTQWGIQDFKVEYQDVQGLWKLVPGGEVVGNNLVWRSFTFLPVTAQGVRVTISKALGGQWIYSRIQEIEAYEVTKNSYYKFTGLKAGLRQTGGGWAFDDFALGTVFNPFSQPLDITYRLTADNPNFRFTNGSVGTMQITRTEQNFGANIAGPEAYPFYVPFGSYFTGTVEIWACIRGVNPCSPANFYAFILPQIVPETSADPSMSWFRAWDKWQTDVPVVWDSELGSFALLYTNYWHNFHEWPDGWYSQFTVKNTGAVPATYTARHFPKGYSNISPAGSCAFSPMVNQSASFTLAAGEERTVDLRDLFGWGRDSSVFMEGYMLLEPSSTDLVPVTHVTSKTLPITTGSTMSCAAPGIIGNNTISVRSPISGSQVSGQASVVARAALDRGVPITSIRFYANGAYIGSGTLENTLGFDSRLTWDTTTIPNGQYQLVAKILNGTAVVASSQELLVQVGN